MTCNLILPFGVLMPHSLGLKDDFFYSEELAIECILESHLKKALC